MTIILQVKISELQEQDVSPFAQDGLTLEILASCILDSILVYPNKNVTRDHLLNPQ